MKYVRISVILFLFSILLPLSSLASLEKVTTYNDPNGWTLRIDGKDTYIKGVVWGYVPIGENYAYDFWSQPDHFIIDVIEKDFTLMKQANINAIRTFANIPPRWVTYIYKKYGIRSIINPLFGRYGLTINGAWFPKTDYSDPEVREILVKQVTDAAEKFKNTEGVLMYAVGNENNYGLEWQSFEIENLPEGEQHKAKAVYLYTAFNDAIVAAKKIDSNRPYAIVNGDIQYLDLIKDHCTDIDVLGSNVYRGISFTDMWKRVRAEVNLPILFMEFGADAFNAATATEDQRSQAFMLHGQWKEMYRKSYGKGEEGNSIGGMVFQWRDEWWKFRQEENLDVHDTNASWANGGYPTDFVEGQNNMNEEWWGISAMAPADSKGICRSLPRSAYYVLKDVFSLDPYKVSLAESNRHFNSIDMEKHYLQGDVGMLKRKAKEKDMISFSGGRLVTEMVFTSKRKNTFDTKDAKFSDGQMVFLDLNFSPTDRIQGELTLNVLGNVPKKELEFFYGQRGETYYVNNYDASTTPQTKTLTAQRDRERVEIYSYNAQYTGDVFDITAFYHVPRFHWMHDGDFFGLLREATYMQGMDIWGAKAPYGWEFQGKRAFEGLTIVVGPEIYWGANPKAMFKYSDTFLIFDYTLIHAEDFQKRTDSAAQGIAIENALRQTTLHLKTDILPLTTLEFGGILSSTQKLGRNYDYISSKTSDTDYTAKIGYIDWKDTVGAKGKATINLGSAIALESSVHYAGLVADGGDPLREWDNMLPYSALGNKMEGDAGVRLMLGDFHLYPRALYRENLIDANPSLEPSYFQNNLTPGMRPRNRDDDPFAVLDNRAAQSAELVIGYDPTPATWFYAWDNDDRENAFFAMNIGLNVTRYPTSTDSYRFYYIEGERNAAFGAGLPPDDVYKGISKIVLNPTRKVKLITRLETGLQQSPNFPGDATNPYRKVNYYGAMFDFRYDKQYFLSGYVKKDAWGPYDYYPQFNLTYPWQWMLDFSIKLDQILDHRYSSRFGIKYIHRKLDQFSPGDEYSNGLNTETYEVSSYFVLYF